MGDCGSLEEGFNLVWGGREDFLGELAFKLSFEVGVN